MTAFLRDLFSRPGAARTVILLEPHTMSAPRQYEVRPGTLFSIALIAVVAGAAVLVAAAVLTPLRGLVFGPGSEELRAEAERNASRAEALEDAMAAQAEQVVQLRALITGTPADAAASVRPPPADSADLMPAEPSVAEPPEGVPAPRAAAAPATHHTAGAAAAYLDSLRAPVPLPLEGVVSRGFLPTHGHLGLDLAADAGTPVLAAGDGRVVLADWTQGGGLTVAVQHAGGYLSVYKHNSRLLRRPGDRVAAREVLALSGNSGEVTSGPHLHVEIWRDGRPLDPATFFLTR